MLTYQLNLTLPQTIADIDRTAKNLAQITGQNKQDIRTLVENLKALSSTLKDQTPVLMANLNTLSQNLNQVVVNNQNGIHTSIQNFAQLSKSLKESSDQLNQVLAKINTGQGTLGKLVND
jgi:phospholipid/cholesterol/gamma-HCH transport system substrate-binding protein